MASTSALFTVPALASGRPRTRWVSPPRAANWWAPIFGWSPEPDYIDDPEARSPSPHPSTAKPPEAAEGEAKRRVVVFTEQKARRLRMSMMETSCFHDAMYHSAIASRLASDFKGRSDQI